MLKHTYFIIFFIWVLGLVLPENSYAQFLGYKIDKDKKFVRLPFEIYNNLIVIPIKLNGIIPLNFVVDTGVRSSIITEKLVTDILRLPYSRKITVNGPGDYVILEAYVINMVDIVMEGAVGNDQSILVLEEDYLQLRNFLGTEVHGMIGYDLFSRFIVEINYMKRIITLYEPEFFKPRKKYKEIDISVEDTKPYIRLDIQLNDTARLTGKFMVDSGASHALMLNEDSDPRINVPEKYYTTDIGRGLGGPISGKIGMVDKLSFLQFEFTNIIASFPDEESYPDTVGLVYRNGTVGGELLSRFSVIFDYFNNKMYFKKNLNYRKEFGHNMSGITVVAEGDNLTSYRITEVKRNSPAANADIRANDYILGINGITSENFKLNDLYRLFNYKEGKKINLTIDRHGKILNKKFKLKDMLGNS